MTAYADAVRRHYQAAIADETALLARLNAIIDTLPPLTAQSLALLDQFHIGGLAATIELAKRAGIRSGSEVLDAGSGLGGPSRYLAQTFGCRVAGVDLAPTYVAIAELLAKRCNLTDKMSYRAGNIAALPFPDASFDLVWTQHVVMNIADRVGLYREFLRVLKPGGHFAFYDPVAVEGAGEPYFPVPWAETPATSTLLTADATRTVLTSAGFEIKALEDVTEMGLDWVAAQQQAQQQKPSPSPLNLGFVVGPRSPEFVGNFVRNLTEGRLRLVMGVCARR